MCLSTILCFCCFRNVGIAYYGRKILGDVEWAHNVGTKQDVVPLFILHVERQQGTHLKLGMMMPGYPSTLYAGDILSPRYIYWWNIKIFCFGVLAVFGVVEFGCCLPPKICQTILWYHETWLYSFLLVVSQHNEYSRAMRHRSVVVHLLEDRQTSKISWDLSTPSFTVPCDLICHRI